MEFITINSHNYYIPDEYYIIKINKSIYNQTLGKVINTFVTYVVPVPPNKPKDYYLNKFKKLLAHRYPIQDVVLINNNSTLFTNPVLEYSWLSINYIPQTNFMLSNDFLNLPITDYSLSLILNDNTLQNRVLYGKFKIAFSGSEYKMITLIKVD